MESRERGSKLSCVSFLWGFHLHDLIMSQRLTSWYHHIEGQNFDIRNLRRHKHSVYKNGSSDTFSMEHIEWRLAVSNQFLPSRISPPAHMHVPTYAPSRPKHHPCHMRIHSSAPPRSLPKQFSNHGNMHLNELQRRRRWKSMWRARRLFFWAGRHAFEMR